MSRRLCSVIVLLFLTFIVNMITNMVITYHFSSALYPKTTSFLILIDLLLDIIVWVIADHGYYRSVYLTLLYIWVFGFGWVAVDTYNLVAAWFATGAVPDAGLCWMLLLTLAVSAGIYLCSRHYFLESMDNTEALWEL